MLVCGRKGVQEGQASVQAARASRSTAWGTGTIPISHRASCQYDGSGKTLGSACLAADGRVKLPGPEYVFAALEQPQGRTGGSYAPSSRSLIPSLIICITDTDDVRRRAQAACIEMRSPHRARAGAAGDGGF